MEVYNISNQENDKHKMPSGRVGVLIVDDSKVIRLALNKILRNDYEVFQAVDGEDGWEQITENKFISAVFSDVSMPRLDGFGLLDRVRNETDDRIANLPFIVITGNDDDADKFKQKVLAAGGDDLITKPFKTDEILGCVAEYIDTSSIEAIENEVFPKDVSADSTISEVEAADILGLDQIKQSEDIAVELDQFLVPDQSEESIQSCESSIEFDIDDEFITDSVENSNIRNELDTLEFEITTPVIEESDDAMDFDLDIVDEAVVPDPGIDEQLLDIEIDEAPVEAQMLVLGEEKVADSSNKSELSDTKMKLEQARKRAMDIARDQAEYERSHSAEALTERSDETNAIRDQLKQIREVEKQQGTYRSDVDEKESKSTLFFAKLMSIIHKLTGRHK